MAMEVKAARSRHPGLNFSGSSGCDFGFSSELDLTGNFDESSTSSGSVVPEPIGALIIARFASIAEGPVEERKEMC